MDCWTEVEMTDRISWEVILFKNLIDPTELIEEVPPERGSITYRSHGIEWRPDEQQVSGSLARYNHPKFRKYHYQIKKRIEEIINDKLYPTYYYDRFYFKGQELVKHTDRAACEVSLSLHISNNLNYDWPIWFETADGEQHDLVCNPGDGVLYKGIDVPHWRSPMRGDHSSYFHQIFFHYVRRDGPFVHHAFDRCS